MAIIWAVSIFTHLVKPLFVKRKVISEHTRQTNRFSLCLCASVFKNDPIQLPNLGINGL